MADYGAPKPIDPIWYQPHSWLRIECRCGRTLSQRLVGFAMENQVSDRQKIHRMIARLRCSSCGERPPLAEVTRYRWGNR